jgi:hypothetical protein
MGESIQLEEVDSGGRYLRHFGENVSDKSPCGAHLLKSGL